MSVVANDRQNDVLDLKYEDFQTWVEQTPAKRKYRIHWDHDDNLLLDWIVTQPPFQGDGCLYYHFSERKIASSFDGKDIFYLTPLWIIKFMDAYVDHFGNFNDGAESLALDEFLEDFDWPYVGENVTAVTPETLKQAVSLSNDPGEVENCHRHEFRLRGDHVVVFYLPKDFDDNDAERLSLFITTLPIPVSRQ